ncbi:AMP-binding protein [Kitasatospora brasiliensis]|uniref:AMP-binding protein n=1 Tax=Kitasatospora brasiliensis TaxID=3058040 RepID=UPI00292F91D8|nr:AMP-binding protein [Kitasatospora sp. K002]
MPELFDALRPLPATAARYREQGWWRDETFLDDLRDAAERLPDRPMMINHRAVGDRTTTLTFADLAARVERFAAALYELGVRPGEMVAFQLPDWWETAALALACWRVGAVIMPVSLRFGRREVGRMLASTGAVLLVTTDRAADPEHDAALARLTDDLPALRHHAAIGDPVFDRAATRSVPPDIALGPDEAATVLFTSGTTGSATAVVHSLNTLYAAVRRPLPVVSPPYDRPFPVLTPLSHSVGLRNGILRPLVHRTSALYCDEWDAGRWLDLISAHRTGALFAPPAMLESLAAEQRRRPRDLPVWEAVAVMAASPSPELVDLLCRTLSGHVVNSLGSTEAAGITATGPADPPERATRSIGRPMPGVELRTAPTAEPDQPSPLDVRGPSTCLGTFDRDTGRLRWRAADTDGWYATGDLVRPDGEGGLAYAGRASDRISGTTQLMIPVLDVEAELRAHPAIADVALVGYPAENGDLPCAVIVPGPGRTAPDLAELHTWLDERGMTDWYWPTRVETVPRLPRNELGKVRKNALRAWLTGSRPLPATDDDPTAPTDRGGVSSGG